MNRNPGILNTTSDSGYVICHSSISFGEPFKQGIYMLRLDKYGDTTFAKTFYSSSHQAFGRSVYETGDGGFILGADCGGGMLIKTDANGNINWSKKIPAMSGFYGRPLHDNTFLLTAGFSSILLAKIDNAGNTISVNRYYTPGSMSLSESFILFCSYECSNGDIISTGYYNPSGSGLTPELFLMRTDPTGNVKFAKSFNSNLLNHPESGYHLLELSNNDIVVVAERAEKDIMLLKTDSLGNLIYYKVINHSYFEWSNAITVDEQSNLYITGTTADSGATKADAIIFKLTSQGNPIWGKIYKNGEYGNSIRLTYDNGIAIAGMTSAFGAGDMDVFVFKTDSLGNAGCDIEDVTFTSTQVTPTITNHSMLIMNTPVPIDLAMETHHGTIISTKCQNFTIGIPDFEAELNGVVYPNPVTDFLNVEIDANHIPSSITLTDFHGKEMAVLYPQSALIQIPMDNLCKGMYILKIKIDGYEYLKKILKN